MERKLSELLATLDAFRQISDALSRRESNEEGRRFYQRLNARCLLLHAQLIDCQQEKVVGHLDVENLQLRLNSRIKLHPQPTRRIPFGHSHSAFVQFLKKTQITTLSYDDTDAVLDCLRFGSKEEQTELLHALRDALKLAEDALNARSLSPARTDEAMPHKARPEPIFAVHPAANLLFNALEVTRKCSCSPSHTYAARLCLQTHRTHRGDHSLDFDMFLGLEQAWQEAHIRTVPKSRVKVQVTGELPHQEDRPYRLAQDVRARVKQLCLPMKKIEGRPTYRLEFVVEDGELWKVHSSQSLLGIDKSTGPVSLKELIFEFSSTLTEKVKRILAVFLGYALLHLHGTPWLHASWGPEHILFIRTPIGVPLKPYIELQLGGNDAKRDGILQDQKDEDDDRDPDDDLLSHPFPPLITLAIMLIEIHMAQPIQSLAQSHGLEYYAGMGDDAMFIVVDRIFQQCKREISGQSRAAIENCLSTYLWLDPSGVTLGENALRSILYSEVIQHLEDELEQMFTYLSVYQLDSIAQEMDFFNYGFPMSKTRITQELHEVKSEALLQRETPHPSMLICTDTRNRVPLLAKRKASISSYIERRTKARSDGADRISGPSKAVNWRSVEPEGVSLLFDDQSNPHEITMSARQAYLSWKKSSTYTVDYSLRGHEKYTPVKIAILDTGIDQCHPDFRSRKGAIRDTQSFVVDHNGYASDCGDNTGHGTHVCGLTLDYAPDAQVYIAKIADHASPDPDAIARAINHAVDVWHVDMISMSFGFPSRHIDRYESLERSLKIASGQNVLLFAAASNNGANTLRAFPARHESVICIHSTDANGVPSPFNPRPIKGDNFATVGEAVESSWPVHLCDTQDNELCIAYKTGTSFATPIATAIGAFLLQYARMKLPTEKAERLKQTESMKALLREISVPHKEYDYIALSRNPDTFFGKSDTFIKERMGDIL